MNLHMLNLPPGNRINPKKRPKEVEHHSGWFQLVNAVFPNTKISENKKKKTANKRETADIYNRQY